MWTIVFLAMGGIALGKGVMSSGLLEILDVIIRDLVQGFQLYTVVLILSPIILVSLSLFFVVIRLPELLLTLHGRHHSLLF